MAENKNIVFLDETWENVCQSVTITGRDLKINSPKDAFVTGLISVFSIQLQGGLALFFAMLEGITNLEKMQNCYSLRKILLTTMTKWTVSDLKSGFWSRC